MTILFSKHWVEFDPDPALEADDRAQPVCVEAQDLFVTIAQQDGTGEELHVVLIEYRDVLPLIKALEKML